MVTIQDLFNSLKLYTVHFTRHHDPGMRTWLGISTKLPQSFATMGASGMFHTVAFCIVLPRFHPAPAGYAVDVVVAGVKACQGIEPTNTSKYWHGEYDSHEIGTDMS